jgi:hypothetical protein
MKQSSHDDNAAIATDLTILAIVLGVIAFAIYWVFNNFDFTSFGENVIEGSLGTVAGITTGLFNIGNGIGNKWNPVTEWRKNKATEGRSWYTLYLW